MKCAHDPCACIVEGGGFCDAICHLAATETGSAGPPDGVGSVPLLDCGCGHPECLTAQSPDLDA